MKHTLTGNDNSGQVKQNEFEYLGAFHYLLATDYTGSYQRIDVTDYQNYKVYTGITAVP